MDSKLVYLNVIYAACYVYIVCTVVLPSHFGLEFGQFFSQQTDSLLLRLLLCSHLLLLFSITVLLLADELLQRKHQ